MIHRVRLFGAKNPLHCYGVPYIAFVEPAAGIDVFLFTARQIVQDHDVVSTLDIRVSYVGSDESCTPGHDDLHNR
jgi:hypothetical protein